jgi:hypothetical protein
MGLEIRNARKRDERERHRDCSVSKWENGDSSGFFTTVADDLIRTAIGHTSISGVSHSKAEYMGKDLRGALLGICFVNSMI